MVDKPPPQPPDYAVLAQRYLELWQDQIAKLARDPQELSGLTAAWSKMAAALTPRAPYGPAASAAPGHDRSASSQPPGAAAAGPAHGDGRVDASGGHGRPGGDRSDAG